MYEESSPVPQRLQKSRYRTSRNGNGGNYDPIDAYFRATYFFQKATDSEYLSKSRGTPLPPCSLPRQLRMIVMGCMGSS